MIKKFKKTVNQKIDGSSPPEDAIVSVINNDIEWLGFGKVKLFFNKIINNVYFKYYKHSDGTPA